MLSRFDNVHGSDAYGNPVDELPEEVLASIKRNGVGQPSPSRLLYSADYSDALLQTYLL